MRGETRPAYGLLVGQRRWILRGGDSKLAILVIAENAERLDALALEVSTLGYYTFVATPEAVAALVAVTKFDLVVVLGDLLGQIGSPIESEILTIEARDERRIIDRIRARLAH